MKSLLSPLATKAIALLATMVVMAFALAHIHGLVAERQQTQREAVASVQQSHAGAQDLLGPLLMRACSETWATISGSGRDAQSESHERHWQLHAPPSSLDIDATTHAQPRYRGLFKVNTYAAELRLRARWDDVSALVPAAEHAGSRLSCQPPRLWLATTDVRGLRSARVELGGQPARVWPGTGHAQRSGGLHVLLPDLPQTSNAASAGAVDAAITLELIGTAQLAIVPAAEHTHVALASDWPHPSFGGRFLPQSHDIGAAGFKATWQLSSLATSAGADAANGKRRLCSNDLLADACLDTLAVDFIDPVNPYSLADRAIKYGLLFVAMTFVAIALAEALARDRARRVHPVQYALVGLALAMFFLLLLSLSEHLPFAIAYAVATAACAALLGMYARHMFGRPRDGTVFGAAVASLYGLLYLLLQREQTALLLGTLALFAALAAVMWVTRRVDWYGLAASRGGARAEAADGAA